VIGVLVASMVCSPAGLAAPDAASVLRSIDEATQQANDAVITMSLAVKTGDGKPLKRQLRIWQLGRDRRMVKFLAPARLKGTGILVPKPDQTFLYLPAYRRVRRIVGAQGDASFMGTGFSIDDMARVGFGTDYTAAIHSQTAETWSLRLLPKDSSAHKHAALTVTARKSDFLVTRIVSLDATGSRLRTIDASDFRRAGKRLLAHSVRVEEHASGRITTATIESATFDSGLSASDFTERKLMRTP
jgi:hypothetical protein